MKSNINGNSSGIAQDGQTPSAEYLNSLAHQLPQMSALFEQLSSGETPDWLTVMAGLSEMVAFYTEGDSPSPPDCKCVGLQTQNKCRFCS